MVWGVNLHEHGANPFSLGAIEVIADERFVDNDAELTTVAELCVQGAGLRGIALGNFLQRTILKETSNRPINPSRTGAELTLLGLQTIELGQDLDRHCDNVLIELEQGLGIVNQYVGVQDVSLFHVT